MAAITASWLAGVLSYVGGPIDAAAYSRAIDVCHRYRYPSADALGPVASHLARIGYLEPGSTLHGYVTQTGADPRFDLPDVPEVTVWSARGAAMNLDQATDYAQHVLATLGQRAEHPNEP